MPLKACRHPIDLLEPLHRLPERGPAWLGGVPGFNRQIQSGDPKGSIPIHPYTLFENQGFGTASWHELISRYAKGREDWIALVIIVDPRQEIKTAKRTWTLQTLTKRLVEHEINHLREIRPEQIPAQSVKVKN